ncbi:hypothetical protein [Hazenella coriacea]|uniref:Uncharacterized protein n=1 Tax=Hazenella coriacea TaxID=1179467 RepID=A0A4R3L7K2_9BACL|nr:hypothetical protein [Hazenella coriacea]TCS94940.1 hypothetical protein EDD58_103365 [Hazenella coriacea]
MKKPKNVRPTSLPKMFLTADSQKSQQALPSPTSYIDQVRKFTNEISKRSNQVDQLMQAMNSLNFAFKDQEGLKKLIESLAKLNESQQKKASPPPSTGKTGGGNSPATPKLTGDSFYDLFNSPAMKEIVKEVFKSKS